MSDTTVTDREVGKFIESISELSRRMESMEHKVDNLQTSFNVHPMQCLSAMKKDYVTREEFGNVERFINTIRTALLVGFLGAVGGAIVVGIQQAAKSF